MPDPAARPHPPWRRPVELGASLLLGVLLGWTAHEIAGVLGGGAKLPSPLAVTSPSSATSDDPQASEADRNVEASRFWAATAFALAARTGRIEALLEEFENESTNPRESLELAIAESSDQELATIVSAVTRIDEDDLLTEGDLRPFASRLVDVALDGLDGPSSEAEAPRRVFFTATTRDFDPDVSAQANFPADQGRIFAMIQLDDHQGDRVLVKWLNSDTKRVHTLQTLAYDPSRPLWSFLSRDSEWDPGRYEVSFYSQDKRMELLGRGSFTIF